LAKDLPTKGDGAVRVIVQLRNAPGQRQHASGARRGGSLVAECGAVRAAAYTIPRRAVADLASDPDVAYVTPDRAVTASLDYAMTASSIALAQRAPYSLDGTGIGIAIVDSGVEDVDDVKGRIAYKQSFLATTGNTDDKFGHGTHVAGIAAGDGKISAAGPVHVL